MSGPNAKRQRRGIEFAPLDNGFRPVIRPSGSPGSATRCPSKTSLGSATGGCGQLPSPFTAAERGRYGYRYSVRQVELSDTRVFDRPAAGRAWFEQTIRDQLDLGRPDKVQIIFDRKITSRTPGRFQTKVITKGVEPVIQAHYKHSKVKQYFKEGRALRTETTVNDPYDFGVKRTLNATPGSSCGRSAMTSTTACLTPNFRRAPARQTPATLSVWCRRPSRTANPRPPCTSVTPG